MKKSKRYLEVKSKIEDKEYSLNDSLSLIKDISSSISPISFGIFSNSNLNLKESLSLLLFFQLAV